MAAQDLSQADVAYLVDMHHGFEGIPSSLHAKLCHKLVNGILDHRKVPLCRRPVRVGATVLLALSIAASV